MDDLISRKALLEDLKWLKSVVNESSKNEVQDFIDRVESFPKTDVDQKWIPVFERLPEPETDVLAFCGGCIDILTYRYNKWGNVCFMFRDECGYWKETFGKITHWMPLPEPPVNVEGKE